MMTVYRVQDAEGRGPFRPGFSHQWVQDRPDHDHLLPWTHEMPRALSSALIGAHHGSACLSLDQLRRWFNEEEYRTLLGHGYKAVQIEVSRILAESKTQCVVERVEPFCENVVPIDLYP